MKSRRLKSELSVFLFMVIERLGARLYWGEAGCEPYLYPSFCSH